MRLFMAIIIFYGGYWIGYGENQMSYGKYCRYYGANATSNLKGRAYVSANNGDDHGTRRALERLHMELGGQILENFDWGQPDIRFSARLTSVDFGCS